MTLSVLQSPSSILLLQTRIGQDLDIAITSPFVLLRQAEHLLVSRFVPSTVGDASSEHGSLLFFNRSKYLNCKSMFTRTNDPGTTGNRNRRKISLCPEINIGSLVRRNYSYTLPSSRMTPISPRLRRTTRPSIQLRPWRLWGITVSDVMYAQANIGRGICAIPVA